MASTRIVAQHAELRAATTRLWAALRDRLNGACAWVDTHPATDDLLAELPDPDRAVTGGEGTPLVDPASVPEFAALLGKPTGSGFRILAEAMKLRHRLPRLWMRVQALEVAADDACRVAARTMSLDRPAADWVDQQLVHFAGTVSATQLDRTVEAARALAGEPQAAVESGLFVHLDHDTTSVNGRSRLHGELNLLDGLELDQALQHGAALQKFWGNPASLDVRRAHALAELARAQAMLPAPVAPKGIVAEELPPMGPEAGREPVVESEGPALRPPAPRPVTLHIVIPAGALPVDHDESGASVESPIPGHRSPPSRCDSGVACPVPRSLGDR